MQKPTLPIPTHDIVKPGRAFRHYKGTLYTVLRLARDSADPDLINVIYEDRAGQVWVRLLREFLDDHVANDGNYLPIPRFMDEGRQSWDSYFMQLANLVATRATCDRKHVGAVMVRSNRVIATGYNGALPGQPHCDDVGHDLVETDGRQNCVRTAHAEQNSVFQAAQYGISLVGATLYTNTFPCWNCTKALLGVKVARVVYASEYNNDARVTEAFKKAGVVLDKFE